MSTSEEPSALDHLASRVKSVIQDGQNNLQQVGPMPTPPRISISDMSDGVRRLRTFSSPWVWTGHLSHNRSLRGIAI
ncbi:hypothetical protein OHA70_27115 [Kribbella sp. NBC_00382]|uniref:hypothetical protein n=1 Tax=Kribbella sp. NBC_00382 TaxID=2975967 RepID=UPI002E1F45A9